MKVAANQLERHLTQRLRPIYVISGDEPLQREEALDAVRAAAREQGVDERVRLFAETGFDWSELAAHGDALSLFATRKLIDIRITGSPGVPGGKALMAYCERINADNILLLSLPQMAAKAKQAKWFKALTGAGVIVEVWPVRPAELPGWIAQRARRAGVKLPADAAAVLAERCEGNLLACAQYISRLGLLYPAGAIGVEQVLEVAADSAHFSSFDLMDSALAGDVRRVERMVRGLREEGESPIALAGILAWMVRELLPVAIKVADGARVDDAAPRYGAWSNRRSAVINAVRRHPVAHWNRMLRELAEIDALAKTSRLPAAWDALIRLVLFIANVSVRRALAL